MRPQQNRRARGRNNNNNGNNNSRRGPNPLSRNYESSGPDVKIRGNAQQIADKYLSLARDAQGSGDRVMSENYLQHAEHYLRIILAATAQMPQLARREDSSEQEFDEINSEGAKKDGISCDSSEQQKKSSNGLQGKEKNGYEGDEVLDNNALYDGQEPPVAQESTESVKKLRRASRRRVAKNQEEPFLELAQGTPENAENEDEVAEKISSIPLLSAEVPRKPRRRRVAASRVETSSAEGNV
ncbi:DUF4167 domain-containing protein [Bartonella sp. B17]